MYALTLAGIPISIGANEAVHQQRLLDEEAEADERQEEFYLDVYCDAKSRKKDEVNGAIVVLKDGKVSSIPRNISPARVNFHTNQYHTDPSMAQGPQHRPT